MKAASTSARGAGQGNPQPSAPQARIGWLAGLQTIRLSAAATLLALLPLQALAQVGSTGLVYVDADLSIINGVTNLASSEGLPLANTFDGSFSSPAAGTNLWEIRGVEDPIDPEMFPSDNLGSRPAGNPAASQSIFTSGDRATADVGDEAPELVQTLRSSDGITAGTSYDVYAVYWSPPTQDWGLRAGLTSSPGANPVFNRTGGDVGGVPASAGLLSASAIWEVLPGPNNDEGLFNEGNRDQYLALVGSATPSGGEIDVFIDDLSTADLGLTSANRTFFDGLAFVESGTAIAITASVDLGTGAVTLTNDTANDIRFTGYALRSFTTSSLDPQGLTAIAGNSDGAGDGSIDDDLWQIDLPEDLSAASVNQIAESEQTGTDGGALLSGESLSFGAPYLRSGLDSTFAPSTLLEIVLTLDDGSELSVVPEFVGTPLEPGDLDRDGDLDEDDFEILADNLFRDFSDLTPALRISLGDLGSSPDGGGLDGQIDFNDFRIFQNRFDAANGPGAFAALIGVPEPSAIGLMGAAGLLAVGLRRRRRQRPTPHSHAFPPAPRPTESTTPMPPIKHLAALAAAAILAATPLAPTALAQVTLIDHSSDPLFDPTAVGPNEAVAAAFLHDTTSANAPDANESDFPISRVSLDANDFYGQSFTVDNGGGILQSIFFAYNELQDFGSIQLRVDIGNNNVANGADNPLGPEDFVSAPIPLTSGSLSPDGGAGGPVFYLEFDLSAENIALGNGEHNFSVLGGPVTQTNGDFFFAPLRTGNGTPDPAFDGGNTIGFNTANGSGLGGDHFFAVTVEEIDLPSFDLVVDTTDGTASLVNNSGEAIDFNFYQIESNDGVSPGVSLDPAGLLSLEVAGGSGFLEAGGNSPSILGEASVTDSLVLEPGESRALGALFDTSVGAQNLSFLFGEVGADELSFGDVVYVSDDGVDAPAGLLGDFNGDNTVDVADYTVWRDNLGLSEAALNGAGNGDGVVSILDYQLFVRNFGVSVAGGNAAAAPEPAAAGLITLSACLLAPTLRRRRATNP